MKAGLEAKPRRREGLKFCLASRQRRGSQRRASLSPDLPPGSAQLCSPGFQRGGSHRAPFTPRGFHGTHVRGFGSRKVGPPPGASAMSPPATPKRSAGASGGRAGREPPARTAPREGGRA